MIRIKEGFQGERSVVVPPYIRERLGKDPFLSTLYITDIGHYPFAEHHYVRREEAIRENVLLYCMNGCGTYRIGNTALQSIHENQYVILPAGAAHEYATDDDNPWTIYWLHFSGTLAPYYANGADVPQDVLPGIKSRISNRINLFEEILGVMQSELTDDNLHYASSILHHFLASLRYLQSYRDANKTQATDVIESAKHFMQENVERHVTLQQIAEYTGLSSSYFSHQFKEATGESPLSFLTKLKMQKACELLTSTDMPINRISYKLGITDSLYFSRLFSKTMGVSPSEYRRNRE